MPSSTLAMQIAGRGRLEGHPPGNLDGARFEGRFVIWGLTGPDGPIFGEDVSLHDPDQVAAVGRGAQSAHLVAIRAGVALEGFSTGDDDFPGHMFGRSSSKTRLRIYFDESPDGTRTFEDRNSFTRGRLVAVYKAEEFFQMDGETGIFETRVNYSLLESTPFEFKGVTVDFAELAPSMAEISLGRNPTATDEEPIPHDEEPYVQGGPGTFVERFAVGGTILAVAS